LPREVLPDDHDYLAVADDREMADPFLMTRRLVDAAALANRLKRIMKPETLEIVLRRFGGETFQQIAASRGLALGTVHERCTRAIEELERHVRRGAGFSPMTVNHALQTLLEELQACVVAGEREKNR
jgi:DNA-directed RNA polymerase specialized sigma24 family protein